jgi:hypothetical protein
LKTYLLFIRHLFILLSMGLIGMPEAGRRLGVSGDSARRALLNAGVEMQRINARAWAVDEKVFEEFLKKRDDYSGRGRPEAK